MIYSDLNSRDSSRDFDIINFKDNPNSNEFFSLADGYSIVPDQKTGTFSLVKYGMEENYNSKKTSFRFMKYIALSEKTKKTKKTVGKIYGFSAH